MIAQLVRTEHAARIATADAYVYGSDRPGRGWRLAGQVGFTVLLAAIAGVLIWMT